MKHLENTKVSHGVKIPTCIENTTEISEDVITCVSDWFKNFTDKKPFLAGWENGVDGCKIMFHVYLTPEELQKYYEFEKLIKEGKIWAN